MTRTELRFGLIAGILLIATLFLDKAAGLGPNTGGGYPAITGFLALVFTVSYAMYDINKNTPYATIKDAFLSGLSIAFVGGIIFGLYSLVYIKYINPDFVKHILIENKIEMIKHKQTQQTIDNSNNMLSAVYSPFSQLLTGLGICVTIGAITSGIAAWVLRPKK